MEGAVLESRVCVILSVPVAEFRAKYGPRQTVVDESRVLAFRCLSRRKTELGERRASGSPPHSEPAQGWTDPHAKLRTQLRN
jgi:hypothetical protein